jgi:hypothetical protein
MFAPRREKQWRSEMHRKRHGRNLALLAILAALVVLFYVLTFVKMSGGG